MSDLKNIRRMSEKEMSDLSNDVHQLPDWARKIIVRAERAAFSAYWYRRELVAIRSALHALCKDDARGLRFEDSVISSSRSVHEALDKLMSKEDKAERIAVRRQVVKDTKAWQKTIGKAVKKRSHHKKEVAA